MIASSTGNSKPVHPLEDPLVKKLMREKDLKIASLEMSIASLKSRASEYALRARQAEEMITIMSFNWDMKQVAEAVAKHTEQRGTERAVHQQALIQATLVSLSTAYASDEETLRATVNTVRKGLTEALGTMHDIQTKEQNLTRSANGTPTGN